MALLNEDENVERRRERESGKTDVNEDQHREIHRSSKYHQSLGRAVDRQQVDLECDPNQHQERTDGCGFHPTNPNDDRHPYKICALRRNENEESTSLLVTWEWDLWRHWKWEFQVERPEFHGNSSLYGTFLERFQHRTAGNRSTFQT